MYVNYHIYTSTQIKLEEGPESQYDVLRIRSQNQELNIFLDEDDRKRLIKALEVK